MKTVRSVFLFCCGLCVCLCCSCADKAPSSALLSSVMREADGLPASYLVYYSGADEDSGHYLDPEHRAALYGEAVDPDALCEDYAILIGQSDLPYEIHILHARATSGVPELLDALRRRKDLLQQRKNLSYRQEAETVLSQASAYANGRYLFLLVTGDNDEIRRLISKRI